MQEKNGRLLLDVTDHISSDIKELQYKIESLVRQLQEKDRLIYGLITMANREIETRKRAVAQLESEFKNQGWYKRGERHVRRYKRHTFTVNKNELSITKRGEVISRTVVRNLSEAWTNGKHIVDSLRRI